MRYRGPRGPNPTTYGQLLGTSVVWLITYHQNKSVRHYYRAKDDKNTHQSTLETLVCRLFLEQGARCNGLGLLIRANTHTRYTDMWRSQPLPEQQRQTN